MSAWPLDPLVHEVNTWVWLTHLGRRLGRPVTLGDVPADAWDSLVLPGADAVWLMGVWERSPAGLAVARANPDLVQSWHDALPDLTDDDVVGSPYCVRRYEVDARLGGAAGLAGARAALAERGLRLVLDYVPNHVAPDHPWLTERPACFVRGTDADADADPASWLAVDGEVVARGRDPYFPAWPDVVQLDAFATELRVAAAETLIAVGGQCDGLRCDMAMLLLDDVFASTWHGRVGLAPPQPFWVQVIGAVKAVHPDLWFCAEAYWDREWDLLQQGFDACYDKRLYDRLVHPDPAGIRGHLSGDPAYLRHLLRFLENHDEPRLAAEVPPERVAGAAAATFLLPGGLLVHEGQLDGRRTRVPVFLGRRPDEEPDATARVVHETLLAVRAEVRGGVWAPAATTGWPGDDSHEELVAWSWADTLVVVNLSAGEVHADVHWTPPGDAATVTLVDALSGARFERAVADMEATGLYVGLPPWGVHVLRVDQVT